MARKYWDEAGVADRDRPTHRTGRPVLDQLIADGEEDTFDFAFIDADKTGYDAITSGCWLGAARRADRAGQHAVGR